MSWAVKEMQTVDLGDKRLNNRLISLLHTLSNHAPESIPVACGGWAETKAAYRFFDNPKVNSEKILAPHRQAVLERIKQEKTVLLIQDTTTLNFSEQTQRTDIGPLNHDKHRGILLHPTIAVTPERLCLGVVDTYHWSRDALNHWKDRKEKNRENHYVAFEDKESYKWIIGYRRAQEIASAAEATRIVTVCDREGDLYELYHEAYTSSQSSAAYWLVRASNNRRLLDAEDNLQELKVIETVKNTQPIGLLEFELPGRNSSQRRRVKQAIHVAKVRLSPPDRKRKKTNYEIVEVNVVIATEIDPLPDQRPVEWILLTNVPLDSEVSAYDIVKWYLCRWQIEVYFRILKSGCRVEKLQLETGDRFDACLTLYMIIAWRILYLTHIARECPELPCHYVFSEEEWKVAYMMTYHKDPPDKAINLAEMLNLIARFGGYLNRKRDPQPGPTVLWIGLQKLSAFIQAKQIYDTLLDSR